MPDPATLPALPDFIGKELLLDIVIAPKIDNETNALVPGKLQYCVRIFTGPLQKRQVLVNPATGWGLTGFTFDTHEEFIKFIVEHSSAGFAEWISKEHAKP